ncbi:hypothetical protein PoB_005361300 [Plakobranchus ocellatus]|uniref:Uncharacterized protein n=1 Tax=Plakobranchus ocellatus TaxID=259542 RepID=A0AAV4C6J8_9GAST|nr:hypothetical protein PoB_005361300 [Plakobranchus ocellatus]
MDNRLFYAVISLTFSNRHGHITTGCHFKSNPTPTANVAAAKKPEITCKNSSKSHSRSKHRDRSRVVIVLGIRHSQKVCTAFLAVFTFAGSDET